MLLSKRWQHFAAMVLIGDGVMALIHPGNDAQAWKKGPKAWREAMEVLRESPASTRAIGVAQIALGVAWALRQSKDEA